jgi:hypothetical protein
MITGNELNADLTAHVVVKAEDLAWRETEHPGVFLKEFERITDPGKARETWMVRLDAGAALPETTLEERTEMMVLDGEISDGQGSHGAVVYVLNPPGARVRFASEGGGIAFMKRRAGTGAGAARVVRDTNLDESWEPWGERGAHKVTLYGPGEIREASWVGRMLPDVHVPEHDHVGGEEIFILHGTIEDAAARADRGTWVRFPIGFRHAPFSHGEGCIMIVREGDVVP